MDAPSTDFPSLKDDDDEEAADESTKDDAAIESQDEGAAIEGYTGEAMVFDDDGPYEPYKARARRHGSRRGRRGRYSYDEDPDEDTKFKYGDAI